METAPNCKSTSAGACNKEKALSGHCEIVTVPLTALIWTPELGLADADCCDQVRVMVMVTRCHSFSAASVTPRHVSRVACHVPWDILMTPHLLPHKQHSQVTLL